MEMLDMPAHPRLCQSPPPKDHHRVARNLARVDRTLHLEETDLPVKTGYHKKDRR